MTLRRPFHVSAVRLGALAYAVVVTRVEPLPTPTTVRTQGAAV